MCHGLISRAAGIRKQRAQVDWLEIYAMLGTIFGFVLVKVIDQKVHVRNNHLVTRHQWKGVELRIRGSAGLNRPPAFDSLHGMEREEGEQQEREKQKTQQIGTKKQRRKIRSCDYVLKLLLLRLSTQVSDYN